MALRLCEYTSIILVKSTDESNKWLHGRAGFLYLLRPRQAGFTDDRPTLKAIQETIDAVVDCIVNAPRPWIWRDKPYFGAVHGAVGILLQRILASPSQAPLFQDLLLDLLDCQFPSDNLSISSLKPDDVYVQFCHGCPGAAVSPIH
jgi:hypothetical protein